MVMRHTIRHISTSIAGLEALSDYRLKKMAPYCKVDGKPLRTATQVRKMLREARAEGLECIPGEGCTNYDSTGRCLGCPAPEDMKVNLDQV